MIRDSSKGKIILKNVNSYSVEKFNIPYYAGDMVYFFVRINNSQLHIVRYKINENIWLISDYIEETITNNS